MGIFSRSWSLSLSHSLKAELQKTSFLPTIYLHFLLAKIFLYQNTAFLCSVVTAHIVPETFLWPWWKYAGLKAALEDIHSRGPRWGCGISQMDSTVRETASFSIFTWGMNQVNVLKEKQTKCALRWVLDVRNNLLLVFFVSYQSLRTILTSFLSFENLIGCTN